MRNVLTRGGEMKVVGVRLLTKFGHLEEREKDLPQWRKGLARNAHRLGAEKISKPSFSYFPVSGGWSDDSEEENGKWCKIGKSRDTMLISIH